MITGVAAAMAAAALRRPSGTDDRRIASRERRSTNGVGGADNCVTCRERLSTALWQLLTAQGAAREAKGNGRGQLWPWEHTQAKVWGDEKAVSVRAAEVVLGRRGGGEAGVVGRDVPGSDSVVSQSGAKAGGSSITSVGAEPAGGGRVGVMVAGSERRCTAWAVWVEMRSQREERSRRSK